MKLTEMIKMHYSSETYIELMKAKITCQQDTLKFEIRFKQWMELYTKKLKDIYIQRLLSNDEDASSMSWIAWSRFHFFVFEDNIRIDSTIKKELDDILGND